MATVNFLRCDNFDTLSVAEATSLLYDELIPVCEAEGVFLSSEGNHAGNLRPMEAYEDEKERRELFDVAKVQAVFSWAQTLHQHTTYKRSSYSLKHSAERVVGYTANGELIAALLLCGHSARFGQASEDMRVNCEFKVDEK